MLNLEQIRFCAIECEMQRVGPASVYDMCRAYSFAMGFNNNPITTDFVCDLGKLVEPTKNFYGFRTTPVYFGDSTNQAVPANNVENALVSLIHYGQNLSAEEGYIEFEKIHPFNDGNGRVGAILYNIWNGTLEKPQQPPEYPNDFRPSDEDYYSRKV